MHAIYFLSVFSALTDQADRFFLTCPFKYLTGYDCPGCGFQRSLLALCKGHWHESLQLYPATLPILLTLLCSLAARKWFRAQSKAVINTLFLFTGSLVLLSYLFKIYTFTI